MSAIELMGKLTADYKNLISRHDPERIDSAWVNDPWYRKCPICKKHYTIVQLAQYNLRTPCCGVQIIG